ncbi:MAG: HYExAFE family protein [Planctomycetes bacterium]|nr:HYExAFE family protein [Planctomycetota bacterium]
MAGTKNHYEMTFSGLLVEAGVKAFAVDETRRPVLNGVQLKNFDFLVNGTDAVWALDLKGRRDRPWITRTDLFSMIGWRSLLNNKAVPGFLFAFFTRAFESPGRLLQLDSTLHETPGGEYRFCILSIDGAQRLARPRSERWGTFGFEWSAFVRAVQPLDSILPLPSCA